MLLLHELRVALIILLATCSVVVLCQTSEVSASSSTDESASATATTSVSTGIDTSSTALTTAASSSSLPSSSDGTSASSITSQVASSSTITTSGDTASKSEESTSTSQSTESTSISMSSSIPASASSAAPSTTTNDTSIPAGQRPPPCIHPTGPFVPFCDPNDGKEVLINETLTVRWDPSYYTPNSTIILRLEYAGPLPKEDKEAWQSSITQNSQGFIRVTMDKAWLRDQPRNNLTFYIVQMNPTPSETASERRGPTVSLAEKPTTPTPQPKSSRLGVIIGVPVALGLVALVVGGLFLGKRKTRQLGVVGSVMGRRRRPYGVSQSRRQRMRGRGGGLDDDDDDVDKAYVTDEGFRDEPTRGGVELNERPGRSNRARVDSLGSLDEEERYRDEETTTTAAAAARGGRRGENAFREEVERQRQQRGRRL